MIYSERRGQSQKPEEVYQYIEQLIPNGFYMEIFARRNNLRNGWYVLVLYFGASNSANSKSARVHTGSASATNCDRH